MLLRFCVEKKRTKKIWKGSFRNKKHNGKTMSTAPAVKKILIIGAGLTGSMLSQLLRTHPLAKAGAAVQFEVWDKSRGAGGRAGTSRVGDGGARGDLGLQYLSTSPHPDTGQINPMYDELVAAGVIAPMHSRSVQSLYIYTALLTQPPHHLLPNG